MRPNARRLRRFGSFHCGTDRIKWSYSRRRTDIRARVPAIRGCTADIRKRRIAGVPNFYTNAQSERTAHRRNLMSRRTPRRPRSRFPRFARVRNDRYRTRAIRSPRFHPEHSNVSKSVRRSRFDVFFFFFRLYVIPAATSERKSSSAPFGPELGSRFRGFFTSNRIRSPAVPTR